LIGFLVVTALIKDVIGAVVGMVVIKTDEDVGIIENNLKRASAFAYDGGRGAYQNHQIQENQLGC
jgi:hypothetical protein